MVSPLADTKLLYPTYKELYQHSPVLARKAIHTGEEYFPYLKILRTTRKTVRKAFQK